MGTEITPDRLSLGKRLAEMPSEKRRLVARLLRERTQREARNETIPRRKPAATAPLSYAQQRLWVLDQFQPNSPFYNESFFERFQFRLDLPALHKTVNEIVRRHESLRTTFQVEDGEPVQVVAPALTLSLPVIDLRAGALAPRESEAMNLARQEALLPFDLAKGPLLRTTLYQLGQEDSLFLVSMHHIVCDAWSLALFVWELETLYRALSAGLPSPLPDPPLQYADFALWQRTQLEEGLLARQLAYWKNQLAGVPILDLPSDRHRPAIPTFRGSVVSFQVPDRCFAALEQLSQRERATMFMTLLAAFAVLLHRYTGQDDFTLGVPIAKRDRKELEGVIGFFVNILVIRIDCSGNPPFRTLLERTRETTLAAFANQDVPFESLVEELQPQRDLSRNPLFQVTSQYLKQAWPAQHVPLAKPEHMETGTAKFDLRLDFHETPGRLEGYLEYSSDLFSSATADRMVGHLVTVLEGAAASPASPISDLPLLTEAEQRQVLIDWNSTAAQYPTTTCVHAQFERCARDHPQALAVSRETRSLNYGDLNRRANQLAHHLQGRGVGPDVPVAICLERSIDMVLALLAVLKAGGAYLPLDPAYPRARIELLLTSARAPLILTRQGLLEHLQFAPAPCWCVDRDWSQVANRSEENPVSGVESANLAYIIYTSGSTGIPRGVAIEHRSLMNLIHWHLRTYAVTGDDRATLVASPAFDASVWEIWPYLACGASIHIPDEATAGLPQALLAWLARERITLSFLPTPLAEAALELAWPSDLRLRALLTGGDKLHRAPRKPLPFRLVNHYGPTENTVVTTFAPVDSDSRGEAAPPIGRPIDNVRVYVLDRHGNPVAIGAAGELCLAGDGLARGYFHLPELTAEKFVTNHLEGGAGSRLYKTGDVVRYRADGNLEFLGRLDHQVKIRGFRIELGEIEGVLGEHPAVRECSVLAREDKPGEQRLVAYLTPNLETEADGSLSAATCQEFQIGQWRRIYQETYRQPTTGGDPRFNPIGWNSSYTGLPIPEEEMREQVDHTVARLRCLIPERVLEIGCGTGMLLFALAPHCRRYVGTDFSPAALEYVRGQLAAAGLANVSLLERMADDFNGFEPGSFDLVVLNSTAQYFPSAEYLVRVLENAVRLVADGGYVFVGDIRSLPLLETFHTAVELHRAGPTMSTRDLGDRIRGRLRQEQELVIAPEFFVALASHLPQVRCVEVMLKRGRHRNELTRFRYDVVLKVGGDFAEPPPSTVLEWRTLASLDALQRTLRSGKADSMAVTGVPNARLRAESEAVALIAQADGPAKVSELRKRLGELDPGIDPEDVWALERELPYQAHLSWPATGPHDCFDVVFQQKSRSRLVNWLGRAGQASSWNAYTNTPIQREFADRLGPVLRAYLRERLPDYMVPSAFVVLRTMPQTPNGKIDRRALPLPDDIRPPMQRGLALPGTDLERKIAAIWQEVLGVEQVGVEDNFFDVGGHSLLLIRVHSRLRDSLRLNHSIIDLFQFPTISSLARSLASTS
jgi:amino acid adenylation domain-containing protein